MTDHIRTYTDEDIEKLKQTLVEPLKEVLDRDWEDETPEQIITIARNGIYWRTIANKNATQQATAVAIEAAARALEARRGMRLEGEYPNKEVSAAFGRGCDMTCYYGAADIRALVAPSGTANAHQLRQPQLDLEFNRGVRAAAALVNDEYHSDPCSAILRLQVPVKEGGDD